MQAATRALERGKQRKAASAAISRQRRWQILSEQLREGRDPCFCSDQRHVCVDTRCCWRNECRSMRADWRR